MNIETILKNFGLNEKETAVYLALIELGPSPVRFLSAKSGVNRGTTYDILKSLIALGLVTYYNKQSHQYFSAESPEKLLSALDEKQHNIVELKSEIQKQLPELKSLYEKQGGKPAVKLFEGQKGLKAILEDVLETVGREADKQYFVYSSANLREDVYKAYPTFSDSRKSKKIKVQTIALGEGGQLVGLDERKWLFPSPSRMSDEVPFGTKLDEERVRACPVLDTGERLQSTYEIIYTGKVAHISVDDSKNLVGVVIQNKEIYETQKIIFESLWIKL